MANLTVIQGQDRGKVFDLRGTHLVLGRDPNCDVPLTDHSVSRHHAEMRVEAGKFHIIDLNSSNGTYVNSVRVTEAAIRPGDQIRLGSVILTLGRVVTGPTFSAAGPVQIDDEGNVVDAAIQATAQSDFDPAVFLGQADAQSRLLTDSLRTLFRFSGELTAIFSTQQLVDTVIERVFDVVDADRAFILLLDDATGHMEPRAVRYRDDLVRDIEAERTGARNGSAANGAAVAMGAAATAEAAANASPDGPSGEAPKPPILVSKTIVNYCVSKGQGVLSTNAMQDRRFEQGDSVQDLGIRSAICVPIKVRDRILGVIHVDTQLQQSPFTEHDLRMMTALGYLAGLALQNTRLAEEALGRERLAAVGEAVASLSHYIKNILQGLQGGASVIEGGLTGQRLDHVSRGWEIVSRNQRRINDLVLDMLHYSTDRQPNFERRNVNAVLREVIELVAPRATEKQVEVVSQLDSALPEIWIDPSGIHHACLNILVNAVDAVEPRKGRVTIRTSVEPADANERALSDQVFAIAISDNGGGIPDEQLERIFQAFHSTKGHKGTGLGLAVSRKIIAEHKGRIDVQSQLGAGSTFTVRLPILRRLSSEDTLLPTPGR
jgi:signal transduction histidine kinase